MYVIKYSYRYAEDGEHFETPTNFIFKKKLENLIQFKERLTYYFSRLPILQATMLFLVKQKGIIIL